MKTRKDIFWIKFSIVSAFLTTILWAACEFSILAGGPSRDTFIEEYQKFARTPLFSGFFTMGSFLVALKTNILARIKETYDTQEQLILYQSEKADNPHARYYEGLFNLGNALGINIISCLISALCQFTLGFWSNSISFAICTGVSISTFLLLLHLTVILMQAHRDWFIKIEKDAQTSIRDGKQPGSK